MRRLGFPVLLLVAACARTVPPQKPAAALYRDYERMVTLSAAEGWEIDRLEVDGLLGAALMSLCQVAPEQRANLLGWLDERIAIKGGPVDAAFARRGRSLARVDDLIVLTRIRKLHAAAMDAALADCPFWIAPGRGFAGRQIHDDRWTLSLQTGGKLIVTRRGGSNDVTGGGAGRVLLGRSFGSRIGVSAGFEAGGSASFPKTTATVAGDALVLGFDLVVPAVLRYWLVNSYFELEGGYLMHFTEADTDIEPGYRVGLAFGARALLRRWVFPGVAFAATYERTFSDPDPIHLVKLGIRATFDLDF